MGRAKTRSFGAVASLTVTAPAGAPPIPDGHLVALSIAFLRLDTGRFRSVDAGRREGILRVRVAGQETVLPFSGKGEIAPKFRDKLAYLGPATGDLAVEADVVELDEDVRAALGQVERWGELFAGSLGAAHAAAGGAVALASSLAALVRSHVKDDQEASFVGIAPGPLADGAVVELRFGARQEALLLLRLVVQDLGAPTRFGELSVRLAAPELVVKEKVRKRMRRDRRRRPRPRRLVGRARLEAEGYDLFHLEAASGRERFAWSGDLATVFRRTAWQQGELFRVRAPVSGTSGRSFIPFMLQASVSDEDWSAEPWHRTLRAGLALAGASGAARATLADVRKHGESALALLSELTDDGLSLFGFDGVLVLPDEAGAEPPPRSEPDAEGFGSIVLARVPGERRWRAALRQPLAWASEDLGVGHFEFGLEVVGR